MRLKYCIALSVILIFLNALELYSDSPQENKSDLITQISISGLKRTKKHIAEKPLEKFIGQDAASIDLNDVRTAIIETGILEPVSVEIEDNTEGNGKTLKILVQEKWTIFPLPIFFVNSSNFGGGLGFIDFNAFGINDKFLIVGLLTSDSWMGAVGYIHTPDKTGSPGWRISAFYSEQERTDSDELDRDIRRFGLNKVMVSMEVNYNLTELAAISFGAAFYNKKIQKIDNPLAAPGDDGVTVNLTPGFMLLKNSWDGYFLSQKSLKINYTYSIGINYPSFHEAGIEAYYEKSIVPGFRMITTAGIIFAPYSPPLFESSPNAVNINILPQSFSAQSLFGVTAGVEQYIFKNSLGILSLLSSYQVTYSDGPILGERLDYGVLGAVRFYLKKAAIPAVGLGVSYNLAANYLQGAFNVGMRY